MSMIGNFVALSPGALQRLIAEPSAIPEFLHPKEGQETPPNHLDIDKSWHGIHFLLTGDTWSGEPPLAHVILGGIAIGDDIGYGPARYLTPDEVRVIAQALAGVTREQLEKRYLPATLEKAEIYPTGIWEAEGNDALEYLLQYYEPLVGFYRDAAARGDAIIQYIN